MNKQILLTILFGTLLFSCTQQIDFEKDYLTRQIVLNSIINPDSLITVKLFSSISINEGYPVCITDAEIFLYENDVLLEKLESTYTTKKNHWYPYESDNEYDTTYYYQSKATALVGKEYKLVVNHPQFETLSCKTTIPNPVSIALRDTSYQYQKGKYSKEVMFDFSGEIAEPAPTEDYYRLVIWKKVRQKSFYYDAEGELISSFVEYKGQSYVYSNDPVFRSETEDANNNLLASSYNYYSVFTDRLFNGKNYVLSFNTRDSYAAVSGNESSDTITWDSFQEGEYSQITIELHHITKDTYLYLKSIDVQQGIDHLAFVEPVQVYSNVENGAGIFGSYSIARTEVVFGKKPVENNEEP